MSELLDQQDLQDAWEQAQPVTYASTAYLVHNTVWLNTIDVLKVYTTRPEADLARDAAEALTSTNAGWIVSPFCYDGALGDTVRLNIRVVGYGQPYHVEVSVDGRVVANVYESNLGY
jgi:hypothetical protein